MPFPSITARRLATGTDTFACPTSVNANDGQRRAPRGQLYTGLLCISLLWASATLLSLPIAASAGVYRCDTPRGPIFSQTPCADDAVEVDIRVHRPSPAAAPTDSETDDSSAASGIEGTIDDGAPDAFPEEGSTPLDDAPPAWAPADSVIDDRATPGPVPGMDSAPDDTLERPTPGLESPSIE